MVRIASLLIVSALVLPSMASGQAADPGVVGTWKVDASAESPNGPREVIIRADSSASWGRETVRWRVVERKIWIAIGGEWEIYNLKLRRNQLTLSGGDLKDAVTLKRVGSATPRPEGVEVPPVPEY